MKTKQALTFIRKSFALAVLASAASVAHAQIVTNWVAFNDHRPTVGVTHTNATGHDMRITGNGGILTDFFTGQPLPVGLSVTNTGAAPDDFGGNNYPDVDTPAYKLFDGIVDVGNSGIPGVRNSAATVLTLAFTNLNPAKKYVFRGVTVRGNNYDDRWTVFTISNAASFTDAHVVGDPSNPNLVTKATFPTATLNAGQVALNSGENKIGSLVGWDNIDPGPDGIFEIQAAQYMGPAPIGDPSLATGTYGYGFTAIYLAEVEPLLPVRITQEPRSVTVTAGQTATFTVAAQSSSAPAYQWQRAVPGSSSFANIAGATTTSYTTPVTTAADNGTKFRCVVSITGTTATSREAILTVDVISPTIARVSGNTSFLSAQIVFSEPVSSETAGNRANYSLDGGLTISGVTVINPTTVSLATAKQTAGTKYTVTVNNVKDLAGNTMTANAKTAFSAFALKRGGISFETYNGIAGNAVQMLLDSPSYPARPDETEFIQAFDSRIIYRNDTHEAYGGRMSGWLIPEESGDYELFIKSDDAGQLFLSPDDDPAKATLIAEETTCCGAFEESGAPETSAPITLVAGRRYFIQALWKEGGGGDFAQVAWRKAGDATPANQLGAILGRFLEGYANPDLPLATVVFAIDEKQKWRYSNTGLDLGTTWSEKNFNDSSWPEGTALLALESGATAEPIRTQLSRQGPDGSNIITDYFRTHFTFTGDPKTALLRIRHVVDDGVAVYLNGVEVHRFFLPATGPITYTTVAVPSDHENRYEGPFEISAASLVPGDNVIAAEVHQNSATSSDLVFGLELAILTAAAPPVSGSKFTTVGRTATNINLEWTGTGALQSADTIIGPWADVQNARSPFSAAFSGTAKFYRLRP
jgi:hypothetical protein